ncbi:NADH dehydrogenase [ubiquinone] 1 beta subcomplex subunit 4 [Lampetra fluviatilis]
MAADARSPSAPPSPQPPPPRRPHDFRDVPGLFSLPAAFRDSSAEGGAEAAAVREALRARSKRIYLGQLNDPHRVGLIDDPAMVRWQYARTHNVYPNFRPTAKTSILGLLMTVVPIVGLTVFFYRDRKKTIAAIESGSVDRTFKMYG